MNIVAVTAFPTGVAHTYMAKKGLEDAAEKLGHKIKVETQGAMGIENEISMQEVEEADVVILAVEVAIEKMERFNGKTAVKVPVIMAIKSPEKLISKLSEKLNENK